VPHEAPQLAGTVLIPRPLSQVEFLSVLIRFWDAMANFPTYIFLAGFAVQLCIAAYFWIPILSNFVAGIGWRDVLLLENLQGISFFDLDPPCLLKKGKNTAND
jgi:hypothetical protein